MHSNRHRDGGLGGRPLCVCNRGELRIKWPVNSAQFFSGVKNKNKFVNT